MDFLSRACYGQAVEELSEPSGEAQLRVAVGAVESARQATESGQAGGRAAHVGHRLSGKGRPDLETDVAYRPRLGRRARRFLFAQATAVYLGLIGLTTALLLSLALSYLHGQGASPWVLAGAALL